MSNKKKQNLKERLEAVNCNTAQLHITSVYATPAVAGLGYEKPQSGCALCAVLLRHIWGGGQCCALPYYPPKPRKAGTVKANAEDIAGPDAENGFPPHGLQPFLNDHYQGRIIRQKSVAGD
jgi:hypothetical protein